MLISPAEPKFFTSLGTVSSIPEMYGVDFLMPSPVFVRVGVQRKEVKDLVASAYDGRLEREFGQMNQLGLAALVIEGRMNWTNDGELMHVRSKWSMAQHLGMLWSARARGVWVDHTDSMNGTVEWLRLFEKWVGKERHHAGLSRPGAAKNEWGNRGNREWGIHLLQGFPGIGPEVATNLYEHFGGVPLDWSVDSKQLMEVDGIGKGRAKMLIQALKRDESSD